MFTKIAHLLKRTIYFLPIANFLSKTTKTTITVMCLSLLFRIKLKQMLFLRWVCNGLYAALQKNVFDYSHNIMLVLDFDLERILITLLLWYSRRIIHIYFIFTIFSHMTAISKLLLILMKNAAFRINLNKWSIPFTKIIRLDSKILEHFKRTPAKFLIILNSVAQILFCFFINSSQSNLSDAIPIRDFEIIFILNLPP